METTVLALVCALSVSHADCTRDTAYDVIVLPPVANEAQCALLGQEQLASVAGLAPDGYYVKLICRTAL